MAMETPLKMGCSIGKSSINGVFSIAMLDYQRVIRTPSVKSKDSLVLQYLSRVDLQEIYQKLVGATDLLFRVIFLSPMKLGCRSAEEASNQGSSERKDKH